MTYACIDDRWDEHPKYAALELEHFGLMACAIVYCNRHLTNGFVPDKAVRGFGAAGAGPRLARQLVSEGIWERREGGFEVLGYLDHNPSRIAVVERRTERASAGKRGGEASARARAVVAAQADAEAVASTNVEPSPIRSSPIQPKRSLAAASSQDSPARAGVKPTRPRKTATAEVSSAPTAPPEPLRSRARPAEEQQHFSKSNGAIPEPDPEIAALIEADAAARKKHGLGEQPAHIGALVAKAGKS